MSEINMGMIERLAEIIMENMEFVDVKEVKTFCNELRFAVMDIYDPDYNTESSETDTDEDSGCAEDLVVIKDDQGFLKLK
tara:strand:- start:300 stop:539 length:240 start_codon:yes stop_codon:yes gene_type:complete